MSTSGTTQFQDEFFFAVSGEFKQQADWNEPLANSDINILHPLTNPSRPVRERERETIYDCDGVHVIKKVINSELVRWTIAFQATVELAAGWIALAKGAASAFTGSAANETITLARSGTVSGGAFKIVGDFEGRSGATEPIPYNATPAQIKTALEQMERPVEEGDINSASGDWTAGVAIQFGGRLANTNLSGFTIDNTGITGGGTITLTQTVNGSNKIAQITKSSGRDVPLVSFVTGYKGQTATYKKHRNFVVGKVTVRTPRRGVASVEVDLIGSSKTISVPDFVVPECENKDVLRARDTRLEIGSAWITKDVREGVYVIDNQIVTDVDAFPFDSIYVGLLTRGLRPTEQFTGQVDGCETDDLYVWADDELEKAFEWYLGSPSERLVIVVPVMRLELQQPDITYSPNGNTIINFLGDPMKDATLLTYSKAEVHRDSNVNLLEI